MYLHVLRQTITPVPERLRPVARKFALRQLHVYTSFVAFKTPSIEIRL